MSEHRIEKDLLGGIELPADSLAGIHAQRARENFPLAGRPVRRSLVHAFGEVKLACARANHELGRWDDETFAAIEAACREMTAGALDAHVDVDALQGGAGTSTNMCVNEVLANRALQLLGAAPGDHDRLHPLDDLNRHQSTNDTFPTALRVAAVRGLRTLAGELVALLESFQAKEREMAGVVKVGRTQLQDAVLTTLGRSMGAYAEAVGRDRWRVYKCEERLRTVNLGGTAIGTGLGAPRRYVFGVVEHLRAVTGLGFARAENLVEATQNTDVFAEVAGILGACATNLLKISGDLRLMASGPEAGLGELKLPPRQNGSSIMPHKVNPVIPEAVSQAALSVMADQQAINHACAMGSLELNPFLPLVADRLLGSIDLLAGACSILRRNCIEGLAADVDACRRHVDAATATVTALAARIGYGAAQEVAAAAQAGEGSVREVAVARGLLTPEQFDALIDPAAVTRLGDPEPEAGA